MKYLKNFSLPTLLIIFMFLLVVLIFNYFMWQNYRQLQTKVDNFTDNSYFAAETAGEERSGQSAVSGGETADKFRLAMITSGSEQEKELMRQGAEESASIRGMDIKFYHADPAGQMSPADYLQLAEMADYDGILVEGTSIELPGIIDDFGQETPIVTINSDFPDSRRLSYVGLDHHQTGYQIGKYILDNIELGGGKIGLLSRRREDEQRLSSSEQLKIFGFREALAAVGKSDMLEHRQVEAELLEVSSEVGRIMNEQDIKAIFTPEEELSIILADSAVFTEKMQDIYLVGYGSRAGLTDELEDMVFDTLIYRDSEQIGYQAVKEMATILSHGNVNLHNQVEMKLLGEEESEGGVELHEQDI